MRIHCLQHVSFEGPGYIGDWALARGHTLSLTRLDAGEILPPATAFDWLVIMGGPMSVHDETDHPWLRAEKTLVREAICRGQTVLGVCLGAQLIAEALGARVYRGQHRELGWWPVARVAAAAAPAAFRRFPAVVRAFHWHGETFELPAGAVLLARSEAYPHQAFAYGERVVALQFHLELTRPGVEQLLAHGASELTPGPYVQPGPTLLAAPGRFATANRALHRLLDQLAQPHTAKGDPRP